MLDQLFNQVTRAALVGNRKELQALLKQLTVAELTELQEACRMLEGAAEGEEVDQRLAYRARLRAQGTSHTGGPLE